MIFSTALFAKRMFLIAIPILGMIALIPLVKNDAALLGMYVLIVAGTFAIRYDKRDVIFFLFGLVLLTMSEFVFISTGVEVFERSWLIFGMPIWLPVLWGYAFIMIRRAIVALEEYVR